MPVDLAGAIEAATTFLHAIEREDWETATALVAPEVVKRAQQMQVAVLLDWAAFEATKAETGATGYASWGTYTPEALARYGSIRVDPLPGAPTIAEMATLGPSAFFARWLGWTAGWPPRHPSTPPVHVIGAVPERPDLVHVVLRGGGRMGSPPVRSVPVLKLREGWRVLEHSDIRQRGIVPLLMRFRAAQVAPKPGHLGPS